MIIYKLMTVNQPSQTQSNPRCHPTKPRSTHHQDYNGTLDLKELSEAARQVGFRV